MKSDMKISNALGITHEEEKKEVIPFNVKSTEVSEKTADVVTKNVEQKVFDEQEDYKLARNNLHNLINVGNKAISDLAEVCRGTEQPRAFEVLSHMMKTIAETNKDLYEIQEKSRKIGEMDNPRVEKNQTSINVEKGVFVGSASDLLKEIEDEEENNIKTIENGEK